MPNDPPKQSELKRVALVMAGTQGLGRGCAVALSEAGWDLAVCSRSAEAVDQTIAELGSRGCRVSGIPADVSDPSALRSLLAHVDDVYGRLDALIVNAGGPSPGGFEDLDDDRWVSAYELTLMSAVRSIRAALPRMRRGGYGRVIVIGSSSVRMPIRGLTLSNTFRPALAGLVKSLAVELGPEGITVNMVSPGRIATERVRRLDEQRAIEQGLEVEEIRAGSEAGIPLGNYGKPEDLGELVRYLASPEARYITGQSILVDGGMMPSLP